MKFSSFVDLGLAMGYNAPKRKTPKEKECRVCGGKFRRVEGTNMLLCTGTKEDGSPCTKRIFAR